MIQHFLILKRTGTPIYRKTFGQIEIDETILSGFFSAFFSLSQNLFSADVRDIELGPFRMLFEVIGNELILTVLFDKSDSTIHIQQKLIEARNIIQQRYKEAISNPQCRSEDFEGLSEIIADIFVNTQSIVLNQDLKKKYLQIIDELCSRNEILEAALVTIEGIPLILKGKKEFVDMLMNQMQAFWRLKGAMLDQIILSYQKRLALFYRLNDDLILGAFSRTDTDVGIATTLVEVAAKKIAKLYPR
jgi:predicted regulator of Ras-like GTPase activity (Roadblock/LC7/MglB family)